MIGSVVIEPEIALATVKFIGARLKEIDRLIIDVIDLTKCEYVDAEPEP